MNMIHVNTGHVQNIMRFDRLTIKIRGVCLWCCRSMIAHPDIVLTLRQSIPNVCRSEQKRAPKMRNVCHADKKKLEELDRSIKALVDLEAGQYMDDPDKPMDDFIGILNGTARKPIVNDVQLRILRIGIEYLLKEHSRSPQNSVEAAMDAAMQKAIRVAETPLQGALLALVQHQLKGHRIEPLNG